MGKTPVDIERLQERGSEMEWAVALRKMGRVLSGPGVEGGKDGTRSTTLLSSKHRRS